MSDQENPNDFGSDDEDEEAPDSGDTRSEGLSRVRMAKNDALIRLAAKLIQLAQVQDSEALAKLVMLIPENQSEEKDK